MNKTLFNMGQTWSPEQYQQLKQLYDSGTNLEGICRAMGRTPSAIVSKLEYVNRLQLGKGNHYYPVPEDTWCLWQEIRDLDYKLKNETST